jgi:hypothetical protein
MLTVKGYSRSYVSGSSRRDFLKAGTLLFGGLTLSDMLRLKALGAAAGTGGKSVIMIWLRGGASHIDTFDMKPQAPAEIRGEFHPIKTNVLGLEICEYMPQLAKMADKVAILRGIRSNDLGDHTPHYILTGFPDRGKRPVLGSIVSYLRGGDNGLPPYVSMMYRPDHESETYTGTAHRAFVAKGPGVENLSLVRGVSHERLSTRKQLLSDLDNLRRELDNQGTFDGIDAFRQQAFDMITSSKARDAFDVEKESPEIIARYGKENLNFLRARRLAEAGVSVVTLKTGDWDTHEKNFSEHRWQLPILDQGICALVSDLYERGLEKDIAVVVWGEFGRAPRISRGDGRDHWPEAGAAVVFGGGFKVGQVIGATDRHGAESTGRLITPSNVLATLYGHLGIDPTVTIPDHNGRPMHVLDDPEPVRELI